MITLSDVTATVYLMEMLTCYVGFLLFLWWLIHEWWYHGKRPTTIYVYIMLLLFCYGYAITIGLVARHTRNVYGVEQYYTYMDSLIWHTRIVPRLIIELLFVGEMISRIYKNYLKKAA